MELGSGKENDIIKTVNIFNCKIIALCKSSVKPGSPVNKMPTTESPSWMFFTSLMTMVQFYLCVTSHSTRAWSEGLNTMKSIKMPV